MQPPPESEGWDYPLDDDLIPEASWPYWGSPENDLATPSSAETQSTALTWENVEDENEVATRYPTKPGRYVQDPDYPNAFCWMLDEPLTAEEIRRNDQSPLDFPDEITDRDEKEDSHTINITTAVTLSREIRLKPREAKTLNIPHSEMSTHELIPVELPKKHISIKVLPLRKGRPLDQWELLITNTTTRLIFLADETVLGHIIHKKDETREEHIPEQRKIIPSKIAQEIATKICNLVNQEQIDEFEIGPNLTPDQKLKLTKLIQDNADIFAKDGTDLGRTSLVQHKINTKDATPLRQRAYRVSQKDREFIKSETDRMLQENLIVPSKSPWTSPVVLVWKKNGERRFCVDYRKLNNITKKDAYPFPELMTSWMP